MEKKITVLIVDDAVTLAEGLGDMLREEGFLITILNDALSALSFLQSQKPDVIITDLFMPRMNGFEFIREIKKNAALKNTAIICTSADSTEEQLNEGREAGVDLFFSKPFDEDELMKGIQQLAKR